MRHFRSAVIAVVWLAAAVAAQEAKQLTAKARPGEVRTYRFEQHVRISSEVEPRFAEAGIQQPKRTYRVGGQMVVTFASGGGAAIQLKGVHVLSSDSAESHQSLGRLFKQLSARPIGMRAGGPGGTQFTGIQVQFEDKLDEASVQMLQMMMVLALDPEVSDRPVKPGDRWVQASSKERQGGGSGTHNWYEKDVTIAGRKCALLLVENREVEAPEPFELDAEARAAGVQGTARTSVRLTGAALFDLEAERGAMTKSAVATETVVGVISADRDAEVRVPIRVMTTRIDVDTITQLEAEIPNWSAELAAQAVGITLKPGMVIAAAQPANAAAPAQSAQPGTPGDSLGDIARRAREAKQNKTPR